MDKRTILRNSLLFSGMNERDLAEIAGITGLKRFEKGETILNEGDPADTLYILGSGRIEVFKLSPEGKKQTLRIVLPGEAFAEVAMFSEGVYPAYADALSECEIVCVAKIELIRLLKTNPELSLRMINSLANLLRGFTGMVEDLCLKDVSARVAKFLLDRSITTGSDFFHLEMKMGEMAQRICTVSETLSRTLRKMRVRGIIDVKGKTITILDKETLQRIASGMKI
jgi:CRP/FNR family transcriptional regulator